MNKTKDNFTTPKQTKRLGLKRNNSVLKDSAEKTIKSTTTTISVLACKTKSTPRRLPQSDVRINYRNSESKEAPDINTPGTPKSSSELQRQAVSTNCRPYRLSLSKKVREKMTKKRLEFHLANEIEKDEDEIVSQLDQTECIKTNVFQDGIRENFECEAIEKCIENDCNVIKHKTEENNDSCSTKIVGKMTSQELMAEIETLRRDLVNRQEHAKKVKELKEAIDIWKNGFTSALSDLQQRIETRLDTKTLLDQLRIPQEMLKYVND